MVDPERARIRLHIEPPLTAERERCLPNSCLSQSGGWEPRGQHASMVEFLLNVHFLVCRRLPYYRAFRWSLATSSSYSYISLLMGAPLSWLLQNSFLLVLVSKCHTLGTSVSKYKFAWNRQTLMPKPFPFFYSLATPVLRSFILFPCFLVLPSYLSLLTHSRNYLLENELVAVSPSSSGLPRQ